MNENGKRWEKNYLRSSEQNATQRSLSLVVEYLHGKQKVADSNPVEGYGGGSCKESLFVFYIV